MSIIIMVDSGANLSKSMLKKYELNVLPYNVTFKNGDTYRDILDIKNLDELLIMINRYQEIPEIDQVSNQDIEDCFTKIINQGNDILYIGVSSKLSSAFNRIKTVASKYSDSMIQVIDSLNAGSGEALLAMYAREYLDRGYGLKQTAKYLNEIKYFIKSYYTINEPAYMYRQSRCDEVNDNFINYYRSVPVAEIDKGKIVVTFNGKETNLAQQILKNAILDNSNYIDDKHIVISYSGNKEDALRLKHSSNKLNKDFNISVLENSSSVFINTGDNCLSVAFLINSKAFK